MANAVTVKGPYGKVRLSNVEQGKVFRFDSHSVVYLKTRSGFVALTYGTEYLNSHDVDTASLVEVLPKGAIVELEVL